MTMTLRADGISGGLTFDGRIVAITRTGLRARAWHGGSEKRIPLRAVMAVQWKPPSPVAAGYLQLVIQGSQEMKSVPLGRRVFAARTDENTVTFASRHQSAMEQVRDAIEAALEAREAGLEGTLATPQDAPER